MEKRNAFRKRGCSVMSSGARDCHYRVNRVGEHDFVSLVVEPVGDELKFGEPSPTLDEMRNAGVNVKEVSVDGILDSYDVNDTPLMQFEEKIVTKGRKSKSKTKEVNENE